MNITPPVFAFALLAAACHAPAPAAPERPECTDRALLVLEASYVAAIMSACDGYTFDACPAREAIDADYDARRKAWVECKPAGVTP